MLTLVRETPKLPPCKPKMFMTVAEMVKSLLFVTTKGNDT